MLSIIIPTLNAASALKETLGHLNRAQARLAFEVIIADGGSVDDTLTIAERGGAIVIEAQRGRGRQLAEGAAAAAGDWLLFLHADTRPDDRWVDALAAFIADPDNRRRAGYFRFALDDTARAARFLEALVGWRCWLLGLPYGDQGLLISRLFYDEVGGYRRMPLMEDVEIGRRIGRRNLAVLNAHAVTAADKYRRDGYVLRPLRNLFCLGLYSVGVSPRYISGIYR